MKEFFRHNILEQKLKQLTKTASILQAQKTGNRDCKKFCVNQIQDKLYLSSRINVKINIDPGGYFYGKTKKTFTGTQSVHQQPHRALSSRGCCRCAGHAQGPAGRYPAGDVGSRNG